MEGFKEFLLMLEGGVYHKHNVEGILMTYYY